jgi:hypothetical protein
MSNTAPLALEVKFADWPERVADVVWHRIGRAFDHIHPGLAHERLEV